MPTPRVVVECPLKFACTSRRWSDLEQTKSKHVRHCSTCAKDVFFVQSQAEWDQKVASGACVAMYPSDKQALSPADVTMMEGCPPASLKSSSAHHRVVGVAVASE